MKQDGRWQRAKYIVSDDPAFVYFVIPKVGCSSIKTALLPSLGMTEPPDGAYGVHTLFDGSPHQIDKAWFLEGRRDRFLKHHKFVFVRNPWDRIVSCWAQKFALGGQGGIREDFGGERLWVGMGFHDFAETVCRIPDEIANGHFRSQHVVACTDGREKRVMADFVGRFERLEDDFVRVAERIGLNARLPHLLPSDRGHYRDFYDGRLAAMVGERYRLDAEIFGYSF